MPATCGEFVQGIIGGRPVLVSCPIDRYVTAEVQLRPDGALRGPADRPKALRALRLALWQYAPPGNGADWTLDSGLPVAKGFGTSTADIAATIVAVARANGREPDPADVAALAVSIEPTDSSIFPGLTTFDHREGRWLRFLGEPPPLQVAVFDLGGQVDTISFHACDGYRELSGRSFGAIFRRFCRGVATGEAAVLGQAATDSAFLHQAVLPKAQLPDFQRIAREAGACGLVVAHSGTLVGLLTDRGAGHAETLRGAGSTLVPEGSLSFVARVVGGGWQ